MASEASAPAGRRSILVIEDDASITLALRLNLEAEGYSVCVAHDGESGLQQARARRPDLILLDLMLPRLNGFEVLKALRTERPRVPAIVLSVRDAEPDIVRGLELGAEDYVTKPFSLAELLARIKTVLRRQQPPEAPAPPLSPRGQVPPTGQAGELEIDAQARTVRLAGDLVSMTATEFDILLCLAEHRGRVLSRGEIQNRVWGPGHHGTLRTIDNFMMQLRTKLEKDPTKPELLQTVRGVGYRLGSGLAEG